MDELEKLQPTEGEITENQVDEPDNTPADNENEADFADTPDTSEPNTEDKKGKEDKPAEKKDLGRNERNAEDARRRREAEKAAEIKKAKSEAIIETLNGINPYTNEKMEDEADVEEYLTMKEIEKSGKDPVEHYSRFVKEKAKEKQKIEQEAGKQEEWFDKDKTDFQAKHPDIKLDDLVNDTMFSAFAGGKVGKFPLEKIYADYQQFEKLSEERAKTKAAQILANTAATPGKLSSKDTDSSNYFTREQVKDMSKEEVHKNYEKILASQTRWK